MRYLPKAFHGAVKPAPMQNKSFGLGSVQAAASEVFAGSTTEKKAVISSQERSDGSAWVRKTILKLPIPGLGEVKDSPGLDTSL